MGSPFCSTCGGFIVPGSKHSSEECKERTENNNQEHSNDTDTEQFKQPKHGWLVAYFQPLEDKEKFPNLYVYKIKHITNAQGYTKATVSKGSNFFTGIYMLYNTPYEKNGQKHELRLSKGILYYKSEKMHVKHSLKVSIKDVLRLSRDNIFSLENKLEARLNDEWCLEREDSWKIIRVIKKDMEF